MTGLPPGSAVTTTTEVSWRGIVKVLGGMTVVTGSLPAVMVWVMTEGPPVDSLGGRVTMRVEPAGTSTVRAPGIVLVTP